ncbi:unnamed protein product, partial [Mesorhabditis belari]|uniref:Major facilitator superfamily (MFS) profile domain-containing protein n=1 Tax=Mesorhabditis belari TaxID=2138241 RepID=A0AAF3J1D1_9BILA
MGYHGDAGPEDEQVPLWRRCAGLVILTLLHAMTYADRFGIAGVLPKLMKFYDINNSQSGLLSTLFMAATIVGSPIAGYFGDRYNRKMIMFVGGIFWVLIMVATSFVPEDMFWLFMVLRCIDGFSDNIVYACAPSLIADYFFGKYRNYAFMVFYYGLNFGGQFGAIFATVIADEYPWQWSLRLVPAITAVLLVFLFFVIQEPPRIKKEGRIKDTGLLGDVKYLLSKKTYIFVCLTRGMIAHTSGVSAWWNPDIVSNTMEWYKNISMEKYNNTFHNVNYKNYVIISMCAASVVGIAGNTILVNIAEAWKKGRGVFKNRQNFRAPAIMIIICLCFMAPNIYGQQMLLLVDLFLFLASQLFSMFWGGSFFVLATDIIYSVTTRDRRATTIMYCYLFEHTIGDGPGPYIAGAIADAFRGDKEDHKSEVWSLLNAFHFSMACVVPAIIFSICVFIFMKDDYQKNLEDEEAIEGLKLIL